MALDIQIKNLITRIGTEFKAVRTLVTGSGTGGLTGLTTTDKTSIIAAINELDAAIELAASSGGAAINDAAPATTSVYSSQKTTDLVAALKTEILGGATSAYDTLQELKAYFDADDTADDTQITSILDALGKRLRFDAVQTLTAPEKAQALANLGIVAASETVAGQVELATPAETTTGTDNTRAATPAGVKAVADTKAPLAHTHAAGDLPTATTTQVGLIEVATTAETQTGSSTTLAATPAGVKAVADTKAPLAHTHGAGDLPAASATQVGLIEIATDTEATTGTDTQRAMTPANVRAVTGDPSSDYVALFNTAIA